MCKEYKAFPTGEKLPSPGRIRVCNGTVSPASCLKSSKKRVVLAGLLICFFVVFGQTLVHVHREFIFRVNYNTKIVGNGIKSIKDGAQEIPKIIHQIFFNVSKNRVEFMAKYKPYRQTWMDYNPEYKYILWNATMIRKLIDEHYPHIKPTFDKYNSTWVSQADMARYLIIHHMGGFYVDIDIKCRRRLSELCKESGYKPVILEPGYNPIGFNIDFFGAARNHTYMTHVINGLRNADVMYFTPHVGVIMRTGPMFMLGRYWNYPYKDEIYQIPPETVQVQAEREHAGSWHQIDDYFIKLGGKISVINVVLIIVILIILYQYCKL